MKRIRMFCAGLTLLGSVFSAHPVSCLDRDPYAPLKLYDGSWEIRVSKPEARTDHLINHCAQTGLFYVCEQIVNGKTSALVVFLPIGTNSSGAEQYRTQPLVASGAPGGEWGNLTITGDNWLYFWDSQDSKKLVHWRVKNHFTGKDKIHFEVQSSEDGTNWNLQSAGDEERSE
jgi:hypothetical protein